MDVAELIDAAAAHIPGLLVAADFDGTLAPLVPDPERSRPADGAVEALQALAARGVHIGVITGRGADTAVRLGGLSTVPGIVVTGLYGLERWVDGAIQTQEEPPSILELRTRLPRLMADHEADPAAWIEDKRLSLVVHTRRSPDPAAEQERLREPAEALADELGLELHGGRMVLEFRLPGFDKGDALRRLAAETKATAVLFAGDDVGDLPAFAAVRDLPVPGWGVASASDDVPEVRAAADVAVDGPDGIVDLLARLVVRVTPSR